MNAKGTTPRNLLSCRLFGSTSPWMVRRERTLAAERESVLLACQIVSLLVLTVAVLGHCASLRAEEPAETEPRNQSMKYMERQFLGMKAHVQADSGKTAEVEPIAQPLLRFSDPDRESSDGTLWAWGKSGRPLALVAVERGAGGWTHALVSLRTKESPRISVTTREGWRWSPAEVGLEFQPFPDPPGPAAEIKMRQMQMEQLARRFALTEFWGKQYELRLLPQTVHRYSYREEGGDVDGTIFVHAHGTNPEAVLLIECRPESDSPWSYAFAPVADAMLTARLDGKQVWTKPRHLQRPKSQTTYSTFRP